MKVDKFTYIGKKVLFLNNKKIIRSLKSIKTGKKRRFNFKNNLKNAYYIAHF